MLSTKAVLVAGLFCSVFFVASCGDDSGIEVADVTTTKVVATTTESSPQSTTEPVPETTTTTTTQAPPAASGGADTPEAALRQMIEAKSLGQTGRTWDLVLPSQQALLNRDTYFTCGTDTPFEILSIEVVDEYPERLVTPGIGEQDSMALTLKLTGTVGGQEFSDTDTYHAYKESDRWYTSVNEEVFDCAKA